MFVECAAAVGADPGQSLNEQVFAARRSVEVVVIQRDQEIWERIDPGLEERQVGRRSSLESEARIRTIRETEEHMTGPCEVCGNEQGDNQ
jgi:hypothetical protein